MGSSGKSAAADRQRGEPCFIFFFGGENAAERASGRLGDDQIKMLGRMEEEKNDEGDNLERGTKDVPYHPLFLSPPAFLEKLFFDEKGAEKE